ncbi:MAG: hypothetical protein ACK6CU_08950 [Deltaproteobacteria bacterium]
MHATFSCAVTKLDLDFGLDFDLGSSLCGVGSGILRLYPWSRPPDTLRA